jgi:membrane protein
MATIIGAIVAIFGASGVFGALQEALNTIWGVKPKLGGEIWAFVRARFLSFAMVGGICFLLLVSLTVEAVLRGSNDYLKDVLPGGDIVALALFLLFDISVIVLLFGFIFRYLPDAKMKKFAQTCNCGCMPQTDKDLGGDIGKTALAIELGWQPLRGATI